MAGNNFDLLLKIVEMRKLSMILGGNSKSVKGVLSCDADFMTDIEDSMDAISKLAISINTKALRCINKHVETEGTITTSVTFLPSEVATVSKLISKNSYYLDKVSPDTTKKVKEIISDACQKSKKLPDDEVKRTVLRFRKDLNRVGFTTLMYAIAVDTVLLYFASNPRAEVTNAFSKARTKNAESLVVDVFMSPESWTSKVCKKLLGEKDHGLDFSLFRVEEGPKGPSNGFDIYKA